MFKKIKKLIAAVIVAVMLCIGSVSAQPIPGDDSTQCLDPVEFVQFFKNAGYTPVGIKPNPTPQGGVLLQFINTGTKGVIQVLIVGGEICKGEKS